MPQSAEAISVIHSSVAFRHVQTDAWGTENALKVFVKTVLVADAHTSH